MIEQMPQQLPKSKKEQSELNHEKLFGSNIFEVKEGELVRVSREIERPIKKEEIPQSIQEEAKKYAEAKAWFARTSKEADEIREEAIKEFYKIKANEIKRINELERKKSIGQTAEGK